MNNIYRLLIISIFILQTGCAAVVVGTGTAVAVAHDKRTAGDMLEDENIEFKYVNKIYQNNELSKKVHINATSYNGWLLLTGEAPTEANRQTLYNLGVNISNVKRVFNEIAISEPTSLMVRSQDTYITSKIKTRLLANEKTEGYHVKVITENGVVYLMGLISQQQADEVVNVIRSISGVKRIIKLFDQSLQQN